MSTLYMANKFKDIAPYVILLGSNLNAKCFTSFLDYDQVIREWSPLENINGSYKGIPMSVLRNADDSVQSLVDMLKNSQVRALLYLDIRDEAGPSQKRFIISECSALWQKAIASTLDVFRYDALTRSAEGVNKRVIDASNHTDIDTATLLILSSEGNQSRGLNHHDALEETLCRVALEAVARYATLKP